MAVSERSSAFRRLMAGFPTGVSVVTALDRERVPWGMTCTSLCSVALEPPTLLVCLRRDSPTLEAVLSSGSLAVNLLHDHARPVAELFGSGAADRFDRVVWTAGPGGGPHLISAAHTIADCAITAEQVVGDHAVVMAEVVAVSSLRAPRPLMYGMRRYGDWTDSAEDSLLLYDFIS
jgi:flavin reductase (DIM6/NTAB) family NADH-FMN oxidoreductase RutF